jgi:hypothetical protein
VTGHAKKFTQEQLSAIGQYMLESIAAESNVKSSVAEWKTSPVGYNVISQSKGVPISHDHQILWKERLGGQISSLAPTHIE